MTSRQDFSFMDAAVPPVVWAMGGALLQRLFPARRPPGWVRALALLVILASAALGVWAVQGFREEPTTVDPHHIHEASSLVTSGAHSVSRNPMYMALVGGLVGVAMWRGRAAALIPAVAVWAALNEFQIRPEEAALSEKFGEQFTQYRHEVARWL